MMSLSFEILPPVLNFIGTIFIAWGLLISDKKAVEIGVARWAGKNEEENTKQPAVQDRIKQRKLTKIGLITLSVGLILELISHLIT